METKFCSAESDPRTLADFPFAASLGAAASLRDLKAAEEWFGRCIAARGAVDAVAMGAVIGAASKDANPRAAAERWFARVSKFHINPSIVMFGGLLTAAANASDFQAANLWTQRILGCCSRACDLQL
ncbi:unnamed protein product [Symbiodinium pilosum]|uniref:Uncharacterized protein n=1 Tax=Symbiodinium pilosum TaxID=2952 RepID=A0A812MYN0_SYMPI|nr:unnamed protein product [Symbiodinium pilosum]